MRRTGYRYVTIYVVWGLIMISPGSEKFITFGMPGWIQVRPRLLPCPPSACSFTLFSKMAWYSGVRGASCPRPMGFVVSQGLPKPFDKGFLHWVSISGYCISPAFAAAALSDTSAATPIAPIVVG